MAGAETVSGNELSIQALFPNPLQRAAFHLGTLRHAIVSHVQAKDQAGALRQAFEVVDGLDRDDTDAYLHTFFVERRDELFENRATARLGSRCEEVVDRAIGSVATQKLALRFLEGEAE